MILWKTLLLAVLGFSSGMLVSAGLFAFIISIGLVQRLAEKTGTAHRVHAYEYCFTFGATAGILTAFWDWMPLHGPFWLILFGAAYGCFVGSLIMALAETIEVLPIFLKRMRIRRGLPWLVGSFALGKSVGILLYYGFSFYQP